MIVFPRTLSTMFVVCITLTMFCQTRIDYSNFNNDLATKALARKYIEYRDTVTQFSSGELFSNFRPEILEHPDLMIPKWSEYLYKNTSKPNCDIIIKEGHNARHIDVSSWFYAEQTKYKIAVIKFQGSKVPKSSWFSLSSQLSYWENACSLYDKFETYEELATYIIILWENSHSHKSHLRCISHCSVAYKNYGEKIYGLYSCRVVHDKSTGITKALLNFVN